MPRFFFDLRRQGELDRDDEGYELPDVDAAIREARRFAVDLWIEGIRELRDPGSDILEVRDGQNRVVLLLPLRSILARGEQRVTPKNATAEIEHQEQAAETPIAP